MSFFSDHFGKSRKNRPIRNRRSSATNPMRKARLDFLSLEERVVPATSTYAAGLLTVNYAANNDLVTVSTDASGNVTLSGSITSGPTSLPAATSLVSQITASGAFSNQTLTFTGAGTLTLSGGLSSTGLQNVNVNAPLSGTAANLTISGGVAVSLAAAVSAGNLSISSTDINSNAAGAITVGTQASFFNTGAASTLLGVIGGNGGVLHDGSGTLVLLGNNTYLGSTNSNAGSLKISKVTIATIGIQNATSSFASIPNGTFAVNVYAVSSGTSVLVVEVGLVNPQTGPTSVTWSGGTIANPGVAASLILAANGTYNQATNRDVSIWYLMNPGPLASGAITVTSTNGPATTWVSAYTLTNVDTTILPNAPPAGTTLANGTTAAVNTGLLLSSTLVGVPQGSFIAVAGMGNPSTTTGVNFTATGASTPTNSSIITNQTDAGSNSVFGSGSFRAVAAGSYTISATFTANLAKMGVAEAAFAPILGIGIITYPNNPVNVTGTSTVDTAFSSADHRLGTLNLPNPGTTLTLSDANTLQVNGLNSTGSGNVDRAGTGFGALALNLSTNVSVASGDLTINSRIGNWANNGGTATVTSINKTGTGTVTLAGANTYTGATTIAAGVLAVNAIANGGSASGLGASSNAASNITFSGGTLRYSGTGTSTSDRGFTINNGVTAVVDVPTSTGVIAFGGGVPSTSGTLNKTGAGTLSLAGNNQIPSTTVSAGTLASGPTATLGGNLTLSGSTLAVGGAGSTGALNVSGDISASGASSFNFDFLGATLFDTLTANNIVLSSTPTINLGGANLAAGTYTLASWIGTLTGSWPTTLSSTPTTSFAYTLSSTGHALTLTLTPNQVTPQWSVGGTGPSVVDGSGTWQDGSTNFYDISAQHTGTVTFQSSANYDTVFGGGGAGGSVSVGGPVASQQPHLRRRFVAVHVLRKHDHRRRRRHHREQQRLDRRSRRSRRLANLERGVRSNPYLYRCDQRSDGQQPHEDRRRQSAPEQERQSLHRPHDHQPPARHRPRAPPTPPADNLVIAAGASLNLNGQSEILPEILGSGTVNFGGGSLQLGDSNNLTFGGSFSGSGVLTKAGTGTLTLPTGYAFSGTVNVAKGTLAVTAANTFAAGTTINVGLGNTLTVSAANAFAGDTINVLSGGTLIVTGAAGNWFNGATIIVSNGATVTESVAQEFQGASLVVKTGGTLAVGTFANAIAGLSMQGGIVTGTGTQTNSAAYDMQAGTVSAVLAGAVALNKTTSGVASLTAANTYTGGTTVTGGTLAYGIANAVPTTGAVLVNGAGAVFALGSFGGTTGTITLDGGASITGPGTLTVNTANTFDLRSGTIMAVLAGTAVMNKTTTGTVFISAAGTYSGASNVLAGTLSSGLSSGNGVANAFSTASAFTLGTAANPAFLDINNANQTFASITAAATLGLTSAVINGFASTTLPTVTVNNTAAVTYGGFFGTGTVGSAVGNAFNLVKTGAGTFTVSGVNTFIGGVTVTTGVLQMGNGKALGSTGANATAASVIVQPGGALDVNGQAVDPNEIIQISGTGVASAGALLNSNGTNGVNATMTQLIYDNTVTTSIGNANRIFLQTNVIVGYIHSLNPGSPYTLTKVGGGEFVINVTDNPDLGDLTINAGRVTVTNPTAIGIASRTATINNGGRLSFSASGTLSVLKNVILQAGGTLSTDAGTTTLGDGTTKNLVLLNAAPTITANNLFTLASYLTGAGNLTKAGGAVLVPTNTNDDYTGSILVNGGALLALGNYALGAAAATAPATFNGGALQMANTGLALVGQRPFSIGATGTGNGAIQSLGGTASLTVPNPIVVIANASIGADAGTLTIPENVNLGSKFTITYQGAGNVVMNGNVAGDGTTTNYFAGFTGGTNGTTNSTQRILNWTFNGGSNINYAAGFAGNAMTFNGYGAAATLSGTALQLTDSAANEARSAFQSVSSGAFTSSFQFQFVNPNADGFAYVFQTTGLTALGNNGGNLGYNGIPNSLAVQFGFNGVSQFGVGLNGAINHPTDLTASGINFHTLDGSGATHIFQANVGYDGAGTLTVSITDTSTSATTGTLTFTAVTPFAIPSLTKTGAGTLTLNARQRLLHRHDHDLRHRHGGRASVQLARHQRPALPLRRRDARCPIQPQQDVLHRRQRHHQRARRQRHPHRPGHIDRQHHHRRRRQSDVDQRIRRVQRQPHQDGRRLRHHRREHDRRQLQHERQPHDRRPRRHVGRQHHHRQSRAPQHGEHDRPDDDRRVRVDRRQRDHDQHHDVRRLLGDAQRRQHLRQHLAVGRQHAEPEQRQRRDDHEQHDDRHRQFDGRCRRRRRHPQHHRRHSRQRDRGGPGHGIRQSQPLDVHPGDLRAHRFVRRRRFEHRHDRHRRDAARHRRRDHRRQLLRDRRHDRDVHRRRHLLHERSRRDPPGRQPDGSQSERQSRHRNDGPDRPVRRDHQRQLHPHRRQRQHQHRHQRGRPGRLHHLAGGDQFDHGRHAVDRRRLGRQHRLHRDPGAHLPDAQPRLVVQYLQDRHDQRRRRQHRRRQPPRQRRPALGRRSLYRHPDPGQQGKQRRCGHEPDQHRHQHRQQHHLARRLRQSQRQRLDRRHGDVVARRHRRRKRHLDVQLQHRHPRHRLPRDDQPQHRQQRHPVVHDERQRGALTIGTMTMAQNISTANVNNIVQLATINVSNSASVSVSGNVTMSTANLNNSASSIINVSSGALSISGSVVMSTATGAGAVATSSFVPTAGVSITTGAPSTWAPPPRAPAMRPSRFPPAPPSPRPGRSRSAPRPAP